MVASRHNLDDARVVHKEAMSLIRLGHEVYLLLACDADWQYRRVDGSVVARGTAPDGATVVHGIHVRGLPKRRGKLGRLRWAFDMIRLAASVNADAYHAHEPDLALFIARGAKRRLVRRGRRVALVHDMHEYPPGVAVDAAKPWLKGLVHITHRAWDRYMLGDIDHVFTANAIVRGYALASSYKTSASILYNGPSLALFLQPEPARWSGNTEPLLLCHEGTLGFNRGLREMIEVVDRMRGAVKLRIIGAAFGAAGEWLRQEVVSRNIGHLVEETGWLPYEQVGQALHGAHVGLILFRECMQNTLAGPPNKLFNYMNAGLPVLSMDFPEMRRIIQEERCGVVVHGNTPDTIIAAIEALRADREALCTMAVNGQRAVRERYAWECMEEIMRSDYACLERGQARPEIA